MVCCPLLQLPCLEKGGFKPLDESLPPQGIFNYNVPIKTKSGKVTCTVKVTHATAGQHTITWENLITFETKGRNIVLPPGNCNLYGFPICHLDTMDDGKTKPLEGDEYKCICEVRAHPYVVGGECC